MKKTVQLILAAILVFAVFTPAAASEQTEAVGINDTYGLVDKSTGIEADISVETLGDDSFDALRDYYNDYSLSDGELFERYIGLKKGYVNALESLYDTNYLSGLKKSPETAMKIYFEGADVLFGLDSYVYLYNIATYEGLEQSEKTRLDLITPVDSTNSVVTVRFSIPGSQLDKSAVNTVASILSGIRYKGLSPQYKAPAVFGDKDVIEAAKSGIYAAAYKENAVYVKMNNVGGAYSISLPKGYIPFIVNNIGGIFSYNSYKINPNIILSISSGPLRGNGAEDAINRFKVASLTSIRILDSGSSFFGNNRFKYIKYVNTEAGVKKYFYDYYINNAARLYKIQLESAIAEPGKIVSGQLDKILTSFDFEYTVTDADADLDGSTAVDAGLASDSKADSDADTAALDANTASSLKSLSTATYLNNEEGYGFKYPVTWRLEEISPDIAFDRFILIAPGLSGALDITVQESGIKNSVDFPDIIKSVGGNPVNSWSGLTTGYNPPFAEAQSKLLFSDFAIDGPVSTIYRLCAFIDKNGRNRLCYAIDIIKGKKIYSMFVTVGEYRTESGRFGDAKINKMINLIASSFKLEDTPESEAKRIFGDNRNRKVIFVENYLKRLIDPRLKIDSVEKSQPDGTMVITVGNTADSGYYKIRLDYANKQVEIVNRALKTDILRSELNRLKNQYAAKKVNSVSWDEANMTITVNSADTFTQAALTHIYHVKVSPANGRITWETKRIANREDYVYEGCLFVKSLIPRDSDAYIYGSNVFKDLEIYRRKNMKYRLLAYAQSKDNKIAGFLTLSMDPATSTFAPESNFTPLGNIIDKIRKGYGTKYTGDPGKAFSFDPETFILSLAVENDDGAAGMQQYHIYYNPENRVIDYEKINPPAPDKRL